MTDHMTTGQPSLTNDTSDPMVLIEKARGGQTLGLDRHVDRAPDDSFSRGATSPYRFFVPRDDKSYRARRQELPALEYGPAAATVDEARRLRDELDEAKRELTRASGAVEDADQLDRRETIEAEANGEEPTPMHGTRARVELETADRAAAVALHKAARIEAELAGAIRNHGWDIHNAEQAAINADRATLLRSLADNRAAIIELDAKEAALSQFGRLVLAPTVDPGDRVDLRPANAPPRWQPPEAHNLPVRAVLEGGRRLPRVPKHELDLVLKWVAREPALTHVNPDVIRPAGDVRPIEDGTNIGDEADLFGV